MSGRFFKKFWLILRASIDGFIRDECYLKASALTFYTLLSIVPVLAVGFGIAKGFGFEKNFEQVIRSNFSEYQLLVSEVISFAYSLLEQARSGLIAGVGVIALFWTVISLLSNIESAFNQVWKVKKDRSFSRKFSDYLAIIIICPIFIIISSSLTVYLTSQITHVADTFHWLEFLRSFIHYLLKLIPFILCWILFTFLNLMMPNTKVRFRTALFAGIIAGTAYQFLQIGYIHFQLKLTNYGAIYGSFAALPLFLIWLQLSWIVVLASAEIAFYSENKHAATHLRGVSRVSFADKKKISLGLVYHVMQAFEKGHPPLKSSELALKTDIPFEMTQELLDTLVRSQVLSEVNPRIGNDVSYLPTADVKHLTKSRIYEALENDGDTISNFGQVEKYEHYFTS